MFKTMRMISRFTLHAVLFLASLDMSFGTIYMLTVPRQPYYETNYTAVVTAFEFKANVAEEVYLEYSWAGGQCNSTLVFNRDDVQNWTMHFTCEMTYNCTVDKVNLRMTINNSSRSLELVFHQSLGHIFIKTDKPVYRPGETVKYRVFAVDEEQRLSNKPVVVKIKDSRGKVYHQHINVAGTQDFDLPSPAVHGVWNISAVYQMLENKSNSEHSVSFEVTEYDLPSIFASLTIKPDIVTPDTNNITLNAMAKNVFGQPVNARLQIRVGTWTKDRLSLPYQNSSAEDTVGVSLEIFNQSFLKSLEKENLYVNVTITESYTHKTLSIIKNHSVFSDHFYQIDFSKSKHFSEPGSNYTLQAQAKSKLGNIASSKQINLTIEYVSGSNSKWESRQVNLDQYGKMFENISTSNGYTKIKFLARVVDKEHPTSKEYFLEVNTVIARENIIIYRVDKKKKNICDLVSLNYKKTNNTTDHNIGTEIHKYLTVSVLSKGRIIYTTKVPRNNNGSSVVELPKNICPDLSPNYRIVAYYHTLDELVSDSLFVDTNPSCLDKVGIKSATVPYKLKEEAKITITGSPGMRVAIWAVDKAVLMLNDKQTLTRQMVFQQLDNRDQGSRDGLNSSLVENSGLDYLVIRTDGKQVDNTPKNRAQHHQAIGINTEASNGKNTETSNDKNTETSNDKNTETSNDKNTETSNDKNTETLYGKNVKNPVVRNESWLLEEFLNNETNKTVSLTLPNDQTVWSVVAVGISAQGGICVTDPLEISVNQLQYLELVAPSQVSRHSCFPINITVLNRQAHDTHKVTIQVISSCLNFSGNKTFERMLVVPKYSAHYENITARPFNTENITECSLLVVLLDLTTTTVIHRLTKTITFQEEGLKAPICSRTDNLNKVDVPGHSNKTCQIVTTSITELMCDIISDTADQSSSAEEVVNELGATVHALIYLDQAGLLDESLKEKAVMQITPGLARLQKFRRGPAFVPQLNSSLPATWLTVLVLKTLCHASAFTFVDQNLRDQGFKWLLKNVKQDGSMKEYNPRLQEKETLDSRLMLAAEVLIAFIQCNRSEKEEDLVLQAYLAVFLEDNLGLANQTLVRAKVTYALHLFHQQATHADLKAFLDEELHNQAANSTKSQVNSVEATAYALLVFLEHETQVNIDSIGGWLVAQISRTNAVGRSEAIEALSKYPRQKCQQSSEKHPPTSVKQDQIVADKTCPFDMTFLAIKSDGSSCSCGGDKTSPKSSTCTSIRHGQQTISS
ncbi:complement C3-like isoform X2 [Physella acuta]|uniref:complement C3-like isoform X2 n=1 Tax=Physella acuta TaxID=109671 RepID=UPI0027DB45BA|nr:complement C3-like isoform X2 [Physella acuta]